MKRRRPLFRLLRAILALFLLLLALPYVLTPFYSAGHPVSTLMLARWASGRTVTRQWIDLAAMTPDLPATVIAAEDAKFCGHRGIDWDALQSAIEDAQEGDASGAGGSTITQQVAKNLFLWPGRSVVRKALEAPLALWIDLVLPKRRVLEIYLNIAEWGPDGRFGAEAGSQYAFGRSSRSLSPGDAALLAAILPNPVTRSARQPGPFVLRRAAIYRTRARAAPEIARCVRDDRSGRSPSSANLR